MYLRSICHKLGDACSDISMQWQSVEVLFPPFIHLTDIFGKGYQKPENKLNGCYCQGKFNQGRNHQVSKESIVFWGEGIDTSKQNHWEK